MIPRIPAQAIISGAANIKGGDNPPFTSADFREIYPQFWDAEGNCLVPKEVLDMYIAFVDSFVKVSRYHEAWKVCMCLAIAHFLVLYLRTMNADPDSGAVGVIKAAETRGLVASKSVDGVSVSYDFSTALADLDGWADWKTTEYGIQFITYAKAFMRAGMYIW